MDAGRGNQNNPDPNQQRNVNVSSQDVGAPFGDNIRSIWSNTLAAPQSATPAPQSSAPTGATAATPQTTFAGGQGFMPQTGNPSATESQQHLPTGFGLLDFEILGIAGETDDPNDPLVTVLMAIPLLGTGVEHIYAKKSHIKDLIAVLNSGGFYRAIPTRLERFHHPGQGSTSSNIGSMSSQPSTTTLHSNISSLGAQGSQTSLTESQREVFGLQQPLKWPLDSTTDLLFRQDHNSSRLDITGEKQMLLRRLAKLNKYEQDLMSYQRMQMSILHNQLTGQHSQSYPPAGLRSSDLVGHSFAPEQQELIDQSNIGLSAGGPLGNQNMLPGLSTGQQPPSAPPQPPADLQFQQPQLSSTTGLRPMANILPTGATPTGQNATVVTPASVLQQLAAASSNPYGAVGQQSAVNQQLQQGTDMGTSSSLHTPMNISTGNIWNPGQRQPDDGNRGNH